MLNCSSNKQLEANKSENMPIEIMNLLNISQPIKLSGLEELTGMALAKTAEQPNASFAFFEGRNKKPNANFSHVEFRQPNQQSTAKDGLVIATVNTAKHSLTEAMVIQEFGLPEITPPDIRQQHNPVTYLSYKHNGGEISFGFPSSDKDKHLQKIIIDYSE